MNLQFTVEGTAIELVNDPECYLCMLGSRTLIPLHRNGTNKRQVLTDRFDVRHLLDHECLYELEKFKKKLKTAIVAGVEKTPEEQELDEERYFDLKEAPLVYEGKNEKSLFLIPDMNTNREFQKNDIDNVYSEEHPFNESFSFHDSFTPSFIAPDGVSVPKSVTQQKIIEQTALFVFTRGHVVEEHITTKQKHNPKFAFMHKGNELYPYYQLLIELKRQEHEKEKQKLKASVQKTIKEAQSKLNCVLKNEAMLNENGLKENKNKSRNESLIMLKEQLKNQECFLSPPENIIRICDQYIEACHKHGRNFARTVAEREILNPLFSFLQPTNQYHSYFLKRVNEFYQKKKEEEGKEHRFTQREPINSFAFEQTVNEKEKILFNNEQKKRKRKKRLRERLDSLISEMNEEEEERTTHPQESSRNERKKQRFEKDEINANFPSQTNPEPRRKH